MHKIQDKIAQIVGCFVKDFECIENAYEVSLVDLGLDKAAFIQVLNIVEEQFDIEIPYECMQEKKMNTVNKMTQMVLNLREFCYESISEKE